MATRKSAGFVPKKAHRKSRGGCTTCKRKKVKCDEALPKCHYCALRKFECSYPEQQRQSISPGKSSSPSLSPLSQESTDRTTDFQPLEISLQLVPAAFTSAGQLTMADFELLHQYKTKTWETLHIRTDEPIQRLNREWVPQKCIEHPYLLYTILSITAAHSESSTKSGHAALVSAKYRHKAFEKYNKALQNITNDNYETLLMTALLMQLMVPPPELPCDDTAILDWISAFLMMTQGLRILASLKWASGLEKLPVFPLFRRELRILPPPPDIQLPPEPSFYAQPGPPGNTPEQPDPPVMYNSTPPPSPGSSGVDIDVDNLPFRPKELMRANSPYAPKSWDGKPIWQLPAPAFLPPPLMALLRAIAKPSDMGPIDLHRATLLPVLHALSPIFLSLYHYHLNEDAFLRIIVFPTFLMPEFHALVKAKEPRALIIMGWWYALFAYYLTIGGSKTLFHGYCRLLATLS